MTIFRCLGLLGIVLLILQLICPVSSQPSVAENDTECLQSTSKQLKDPQGNLYSWSFDNTTKGFMCDFLGITCWHNHDDKVLSISLPEMGLQGEFPSGVKYCGSITSLSLSQNSLKGTIPKELCQWLPYLVTIDLSHNEFTGSIPPELHNCTDLNVLHLNGNKLTGEIPWQLSRLERLKDLNVANNQLTGYIPSLAHKFSASSFQNNPGLCGYPLSNTCGASTDGRLNPMAVAGFLLFGIVLIVSPFLAWVCICRWRVGRR